MASQQAWALGFGRVVPEAILGSPLVFTAPVHVEAGEHFGLECVSAEVYYGESRVPPSEVRTSVERGSSDRDWVVRITTVAAIVEPIVEIAVNAGCERPFTRRFTAFADPPDVAWSRENATAQADSASAGRASSATPLAPVANAGAAPRGAGGEGDVAAARPRPVVRKGPTKALASAQEARPTAPAARHARLADAGHAPAVAPHDTTAAATPQARAPRLVLDAGVAHLKLDMEDPVVPAPAAAVGASGAAIALGELDDPDTRQLRALEQSIRNIKRDGQANHEQVAKLQAELADAQSRSDLLPWVLGLLALAIAAVVALALMMRRQGRAAHSPWFDESQLPASPPPLPVEVPQPSTAPVPISAAEGAVAPDAAAVANEPESLNEGGGVVHDVTSTSPLDREALAGAVAAPDAAAARELSVEELLDLEQQADFFIALGQEDAAVDLLMAHLRSAGGQSPLPYTKLLEIYKRQEDRAAYERMRARFNRRFNAYAPDWDTGPAAGRSLEDYPDAVTQIQVAWGTPIDAMAVLEALLFKRDDTSELFDLPAYRDVLVLYSLARDLWQQGGASRLPIDVLLPLDDVDPDTFASPLDPLASHPLSDLDLPLDDEETPTMFRMTGFEPGPGAPSGSLDFQMPVVDGPHQAHRLDIGGHEDVAQSGVHATLDTLSLEPAEPPPPPAPPNWELEEPSLDPDAAKKPH